jgi:hypothetical protein
MVLQCRTNGRTTHIVQHWRRSAPLQRVCKLPHYPISTASHNLFRSDFPVFQDQIHAFIETQDSDYTRQRYAAALSEFMTWYANSYVDEPNAALLTDEEVREWSSYLRTVRRLSARGLGQPASGGRARTGQPSGQDAAPQGHEEGSGRDRAAQWPWCDDFAHRLVSGAGESPARRLESRSHLAHADERGRGGGAMDHRRHRLLHAGGNHVETFIAERTAPSRTSLP